MIEKVLWESKEVWPLTLTTQEEASHGRGSHFESRGNCANNLKWERAWIVQEL